MEQDHAPSGAARGRSFPQQPQEPGLFNGLLDLLPRLGLSNLLSSVSIVQQERVPRPILHSRQHSRALSEESTPDSTDSTQDSTEALLQTEQSEASTSGRNAPDSAGQADAPAVAAARHRVGSANNFDLQVCPVAESLFQLCGLCTLSACDCGI